MIVVCAMCDRDELSGMHDFIVYHRLAFCAPDCREEYRTADDKRRAPHEVA
jgi:hypothetical protein